MATDVPIWIKPSALDSVSNELAEAFEFGGVGLWLDEQIFAQPDSVGLLKKYGAQVHPQAFVGHAEE